MADPTTRNGPGHHLKEVRVRTNVRDTSLEAYEDIRPKPRNNQTIVYSLLAQKGPLTDREIAVTLGWEINCVTGRRNELVQTGGIVDRGKRECTITRRKVHTWGLRSPEEQATARATVPVLPPESTPTVLVLAPDAQPERSTEAPESAKAPEDIASVSGGNLPPDGQPTTAPGTTPRAKPAEACVPRPLHQLALC